MAQNKPPDLDNNGRPVSSGEVNLSMSSSDNDKPPDIPDEPTEPSLWEKSGRPLVNLQTPETRRATEDLAHPTDDSVWNARLHGFISGAGNAASDMISSMSSPRDLALQGVTLGEYGAGKLGYEGVANALKYPGRIAAGGLTGSGLYKIGTEPTIGGKLGGATEVALGILGLRSSFSPKIAAEPMGTAKKLDFSEVSDFLKKQGATAEEINAAWDKYNNTPVAEDFNRAKEVIKQYDPTKDISKLSSQEVVNHAKQLSPTSFAGPTTEAVSALLSPSQRFMEALNKTIPLNRKQREIYTAERAQKFASAKDVKVEGKEDVPTFMSKLAGQHTKVTFEPPKLSESDVNALYKIIGDSPLGVPEKAQAFTGLNRVLEGSVPRRSEIALLSNIFGPEFDAGIGKYLNSPRRLLVEGANGLKATMSAIDFGFPFRQGINYAGRKEWRGIFKPMIQSYMDEGRATEIMNVIKEDPLYDKARSGGLAVTSLEPLGNREEQTMGKWAEDIPLLGRGVRASNRAHTAGAVKLRFDVFKTMYKDYKRLYASTVKLAQNEEELKAAELLNPDSPYRLEKMSDEINVATGRGSLGSFEKIAAELNAGLFAPRLMSARVRTFNRILNPVEYMNYNPIQRKEALKQLFSITSVVLTNAALMKMMGADISTDPDSPNFLRAKFGNVTLDMGGGYMKYIVAATRLIHNTSTPASGRNEGRQYQLGSRYGLPTGLDVAEQFMEGQASPVPSFVMDLMRRKEVGGMPLNLTTLNPFENTAAKHAMPIILQDLYQILKEDPTLLPLVGASSMGGSVTVQQDSYRRQR